MMKKTFAIVIATGALLGLGCPTGACDGDQITYGLEPGQGNLIDENTWESSPIGGTWVIFSARRSISFYPKGLEGRTLRAPVMYVSAAGSPETGGQQFTTASGNLAEVGVFGPDPNHSLIPWFYANNNTCATYFVRAEISAYPKGEEPDAGTDSGTIVEGDAGLDAETSDAEVDAAN